MMAMAWNPHSPKTSLVAWPSPPSPHRRGRHQHDLRNVLLRLLWPRAKEASPPLQLPQLLGSRQGHRIQLHWIATHHCEVPGRQQRDSVHLLLRRNVPPQPLTGDGTNLNGDPVTVDWVNSGNYNNGTLNIRCTKEAAARFP